MSVYGPASITNTERPVAMFAWVFAVAFPFALIATIVCALTLPGTGNRVLTTGRAGQPITSAQVGEAENYVVMAAPARGVDLNGSDLCHRAGPWVRSKPGAFATMTVDGNVFYERERFEGWPPGMTVTCTGPHLGKVLVVERTRGERLGITAIFLGLTIGTGLFALAGMRLRRRHAASAQHPGR